MFCPECGCEYVDRVAECCDCAVPLIEGPTRKEKTRPAATREPVVVLSSCRAEVVAIAKSILMSAQVRYGVRGEEVQDLFGYGRFPAGANLVMGPVELLVSAEDAPDAKALLEDLLTPAPVSPVPESDVTPLAMPPNVRAWVNARKAAKIVAALMIITMLFETLMVMTIGD